MLNDVDILVIGIAGGLVLLAIFALFFVFHYGVRHGKRRCDSYWYGRLTALKLQLNEHEAFFKYVANEKHWSTNFLKHATWTGERDIFNWAGNIISKLENINNTEVPNKHTLPVAKYPDKKKK